MKKAPTALFAAITIYWLAAMAAPDAVFIAAGPAIGGIIAAIAMTFRAALSGKTAAIVFGITTLAAFACHMASYTRAASGRASGIIKAGSSLFLLIYMLYSATLILLAPFLDNRYNAAAAIIIAAFLASGSAAEHKKTGRAATFAIITAGTLIATVAAKAATGAPDITLLFLTLAAMTIHETFRPRHSAEHRLRRSFFILSAAASIGVYAYLTAPPVFCERWQPPAGLGVISRKTDAYDVITGAGRVFVSHRNGDVDSIYKPRGMPGAVVAGTARLGGPAQRMAFSEKNSLLYVTVYKSGSPLIALNPVSMRPAFNISVAQAPRCGATSVALDDASNSIFFNCEKDALLVRADAASGKILAVRRLRQTANIYSVAFSRGRLYAIPASLDPWLYEFDAATLRPLRRLKTGFSNQGIAARPETNSLFIAKIFAGRIHHADTAEMELRRSLPGGPVQRDLQAFGPCGLIAGDFAGASARIIDTCNNKLERVVRVAPRIRGVWHDEKTGINYAACACGVFSFK